VLGRQGFITNERIVDAFHAGGNNAPLLAVLTLSAGQSVESPTGRAGVRRIVATLAMVLPGARIASELGGGPDPAAPAREAPRARRSPTPLIPRTGAAPS
jgi:hypothetical protein